MYMYIFIALSIIFIALSIIFVYLSILIYLFILIYLSIYYLFIFIFIYLYLLIFIYMFYLFIYVANNWHISHCHLCLSREWFHDRKLQNEAEIGKIQVQNLGVRDVSKPCCPLHLSIVGAYGCSSPVEDGISHDFSIFLTTPIPVIVNTPVAWSQISVVHPLNHDVLGLLDRRD